MGSTVHENNLYSTDFITVDDFEKYALTTLNKQTADYYKSGSNNQQTLKENTEAFLRQVIMNSCTLHGLKL